MELGEILKKLTPYKIGSEIRRGIEREALRVTKDGRISQEKHPRALGAALTHPYITTDYSEALLEFVTPVFSDPKKLLLFLEELHIYTLKNMGDEILWNNSMPCLVEGRDQIPIADYGISNVGKMKRVYRNGLKNRYGDIMQAISGIHFNFSLSDHFFSKWRKISNPMALGLQDFRSEKYMNCIRNIHKNSWIIPYLFGSSPVICKSFVNKKKDLSGLEEVENGKGTLTFKGATSLRLTDLGYTNSEQDKISICYNSIESYVKGLKKAITEESLKYKTIGTKDEKGHHQLNTNILQLENEYYADVRPKRRIHTGESPTNALLDRGVEYIELRSVDINTYSPIGIELDQVLFLDIFLLYCLLTESEMQTASNVCYFRSNLKRMAKHGRAEGTQLFNGSKKMGPREWGENLFEELFLIATKLDEEKGSHAYSEVLSQYEEKLKKTTLLNSQRLLDEMKSRDESFYQNILDRSLKFSNQLKNKKLSQLITEDFSVQTKESFLKQDQIEKSDTLNFDEYLKKYFSQNSE